MKGHEMNFRPLGQYILVKQDDSDDRTDAGIIIPDQAQEQPKQGEVIAFGRGICDEETGKYSSFSVSVGDRICFTRCPRITIEGEEYLIMTEDDILCIIK